MTQDVNAICSQTNPLRIVDELPGALVRPVLSHTSTDICNVPYECIEESETRSCFTRGTLPHEEVAEGGDHGQPARKGGDVF